jgi:uncharacterized protein
MNPRPIIRIVLTVTLMTLIGCNMQDRFLYYPEARVPSAEELSNLKLRYWPAGPDGYRGFTGTANITPVRGTVIVFHGNAGTAADREYYLPGLSALGYRVILAEYPGYGMRKGALGEKSFTEDARETIRLAAREYGEPLFLLGESLGCGVAAAAAADPSQSIRGLLLITPWDTLASVALTHYPWLPVGLFLKDRYDSPANLRSFGGRIAVVGAERDEIVPIRHAKALFQALPAGKRMWVLEGVGHNDWQSRADARQWREWMDFVAGKNTEKSP